MSEWKLTSSLILILITVFACSEFPEQTAHGYAFRYHWQMGEPKLQIGEEAYVQFQIRTADEILFVSPNGEAGMRTVLQDPDLNPIKDPDPIADVLPLMGEGDSVTVKMPVSDDMSGAFGLEEANEIFYDVVIRQVNREGELSTIVKEEEQNQIDIVALEARSRALEENLAGTEWASDALAQLRAFIADRENEIISSEEMFYELVDEGVSSPARVGTRANIRFIAARQDGLLFAESFSGEPYSFAVGAQQVIKAWEEAVKLIGLDGAVLLEVPPAFAYGASGKAPYIGPEDTIYYYFEIVE